MKGDIVYIHPSSKEQALTLEPVSQTFIHMQIRLSDYTLKEQGTPPSTLHPPLPPCTINMSGTGEEGRARCCLPPAEFSYCSLSQRRQLLRLTPPPYVSASVCYRMHIHFCVCICLDSWKGASKGMVPPPSPPAGPSKAPLVTSMSGVPMSPQWVDGLPFCPIPAPQMPVGLSPSPSVPSLHHRMTTLALTEWGMEFFCFPLLSIFLFSLNFI